MKSLGLELNVEKTVFLVVRKRRAGYHPPCRLELNGKEVMSSRVIKHFGVMLDDRLTWSPYLEYLQKKVWTSMPKLVAIARNTFG